MELFWCQKVCFPIRTGLFWKELSVYKKTEQPLRPIITRLGRESSLKPENGKELSWAVSTHACGATGILRFDNHPIGSYGFVDDAYAAQDLHTGRSGPLLGLIQFSCHDWIHPIGQATAPDLRHNTACSFRILARGDYFQLYLNDWYVQTGILPSSFTGRVGIVVLDGSAQMDSIQGWKMNL